MNIEIISSVLIVLGAANGAPILAARILDERFARPVDGGRLAADGSPWLGPSKTWRGIGSAYLLAMPIALYLGFSLFTAFSLAGLSMCGDLASSFIKRRRGMLSSSRAIGLDQVPEAGLPILFLWTKADITVMEGVVIVMLFIAAEVLLSKVLFYLHIRKRPY